MNRHIEKTTIFAVYSALVAACYLAAYWSRFHINIFQFAGLTGFASLALYPLMTALSLNAFVFLFLPTFSNKGTSITANKSWFPSGLAKAILIIWWILGPVGAITAYEFMTSPFKWLAILAGMTPFIHHIAERPIAENIGKDTQQRKNILYAAIALPCLAAVAGGVNAQLILNDHETQIVGLTGAAKNLQADEEHPIAFLGFAGGTYFLYESKTGSVVLVNQAVAEPLKLLPRSSRTSSPH